jgi:hypothetical protein
VGARVAISERALDVCPRLIVTGRRARDESVELVAKRAEIDGRGRRHRCPIISPQY